MSLAIMCDRAAWIVSDEYSFAEQVASVVNDTFTTRDTRWWGTGTACASDSKKFGSWDANLTTEWHARYGTGVGAGFPGILPAA